LARATTNPPKKILDLFCFFDFFPHINKTKRELFIPAKKMAMECSLNVHGIEEETQSINF
jgi:hypothetical protein